MSFLIVLNRSIAPSNRNNKLISSNGVMRMLKRAHPHGKVFSDNRVTCGAWSTHLNCLLHIWTVRIWKEKNEKEIIEVREEKTFQSKPPKSVLNGTNVPSGYHMNNPPGTEKFLHPHIPFFFIRQPHIHVHLLFHGECSTWAIIARGGTSVNYRKSWKNKDQRLD